MRCNCSLIRIFSIQAIQQIRFGPLTDMCTPPLSRMQLWWLGLLSFAHRTRPRSTSFFILFSSFFFISSMPFSSVTSYSLFFHHHFFFLHGLVFDERRFHQQWCEDDAQLMKREDDLDEGGVICIPHILLVFIIICNILLHDRIK